MSLSALPFSSALEPRCFAVAFVQGCLSISPGCHLLNTQLPTSLRSATGPFGSPIRAPPGMDAMGAVTASPSRGGCRSRLDVAKLRAGFENILVDGRKYSVKIRASDDFVEHHGIANCAATFNASGSIRQVAGDVRNLFRRVFTKGDWRHAGSRP